MTKILKIDLFSISYNNKSNAFDNTIKTESQFSDTLLPAKEINDASVPTVWNTNNDSSGICT